MSLLATVVTVIHSHADDRIVTFRRKGCWRTKVIRARVPEVYKAARIMPLGLSGGAPEQNKLEWQKPQSEIVVIVARRFGMKPPQLGRCVLMLTPGRVECNFEIFRRFQ